MEPVNESLPALMRRRMGELGLTYLTELHRRLPAGDDRITYETTRLLYSGEQRTVRDDRTIRDLTLMLDVTENDVRQALGIEPTLGDWNIAERGKLLDVQERGVVEAMIDALLAARRKGGSSDGRTPEDQKKTHPGGGDTDHPDPRRGGEGPPRSNVIGFSSGRPLEDPTDDELEDMAADRQPGESLDRDQREPE